jgi:hypothetical protein
LREAIEGMNSELGYDLDMKDTLRKLHSKFDEGPSWAIKQRAFLIEQGLPDPIAIGGKVKKIAKDKDPIKLTKPQKRLSKA